MVRSKVHHNQWTEPIVRFGVLQNPLKNRTKPNLTIPSGDEEVEIEYEDEERTKGDVASSRGWGSWPLATLEVVGCVDIGRGGGLE